MHMQNIEQRIVEKESRRTIQEASEYADQTESEPRQYHTTDDRAQELSPIGFDTDKSRGKQNMRSPTCEDNRTMVIAEEIQEENTISASRTEESEAEESPLKSNHSEPPKVKRLMYQPYQAVMVTNES
jgi:hypothetical protein